jgi:multidrug resistance efflux pump
MTNPTSPSRFDLRYPAVLDHFNKLLRNDPANRRLKRLALLIVPTAGALLIPYREPLQLEGIVTTRITNAVPSPFAANVYKLLVDSNSIVKGGQPVLQLSSADYREQQVKTVAELRTLKRRIQQSLDLLSPQTRRSEATQLKTLEILISQVPNTQPRALLSQTLIATDAELTTAADLVAEKRAALRRLRGKLVDFYKELALQQRQLGYYVDAGQKGAVSPAFVDGLKREVAKSVKDLHETKASIEEAKDLVKQAESQYIRLQAQRQVTSLEQLDQLVPQFRYLLQRYRRFNTQELITVRSPVDGYVAGLEGLRLGASVNQGQTLFTVVDPSKGFSIQATADSLTRAKIVAGIPAVIRYDNPVDGRSERIPAKVASAGALSLENERATPDTAIQRSANFSVSLKPDPGAESKHLSMLQRVYPGELLLITAYGPRTNLLFTFIRPLRISLNHWFGT